MNNQQTIYLERPLPSDPDAERITLGSILIDNGLMAQVPETLKPEDFYHPLHRRIFAAMLTLTDEGRPIDPILIGEVVNRESSLESAGGISVITNLTIGLPHFPHIGEYVKLIRDASDARKLIRECNRLASTALARDTPIDQLLEEAETAIYEIRSQVEAVQATPMAHEVGKAITSAQERAAAGTVVVGTPSGFTDIDNRLQGFRDGQYIIIAARPSIGKTSLVLRMLQNISTLAQEPTLLFSLEMAKEEMADRAVCSEANIDSYLLRSGHLSPEQWAQAAHVRSRLDEGSGFFINDSPFITTRTIRSELRRINSSLRKQGRRIKVLAVDHVGLMNNATEKRGRSREGEVSEISRHLKQIAREFNCVVIALSQLNRQSENRADHRPTIADLRESGSLEQDADIVMLLYREDAYQTDPTLHTNIAEVIIGKNRNGPTGPVKLHFTRKSTRFSDLAEASGFTEHPMFGPSDILL